MCCYTVGFFLLYSRVHVFTTVTLGERLFWVKFFPPIELRTHQVILWVNDPFNVHTTERKLEKIKVF